MARVKRGTQQK